MAKRPSTSLRIAPFSPFVLPRGAGGLRYTFALLSICSVLLHHLSVSIASQQPDFEGFGDELDDIDESLNDPPIQITNISPSPILSQTDSQMHHGPSAGKPNTQKSSEYWDEDEFEGVPAELSEESTQNNENTIPSGSQPSPIPSPEPAKPFSIRSYTLEIVCVSFLLTFLINYFTGKKENENLALAWAAKFATKDSIFEKNFSLLGVGEGEDSPLLLKEGQNVFKFYASGRRCCQGLLATMELKSRHDLISRIYNMVVPCKDEISFEVYMNDDAMDQVVFTLAKKKVARALHKEMPGLQKYAILMPPPTNRKWVSEELAVVTESKEVAGDMITEAVLDQVFGEKAFEKFGKAFISMHFSDQEYGTNKKKLMFKFALPDANNMADLTRLVALVPYYIDLVGRYKLSSQARSKTDIARAKAAKEAYKELQNARQEALQRKKAEKKKMMEEAEAKLSAEAIHKREAKERARQMKKGMPKMKMTRAH